MTNTWTIVLNAAVGMTIFARRSALILFPVSMTISLKAMRTSIPFIERSSMLLAYVLGTSRAFDAAGMETMPSGGFGDLAFVVAVGSMVRDFPPRQVSEDYGPTAIPAPSGIPSATWFRLFAALDRTPAPAYYL
jgi:hypothetical protein